MYMQTAVGSQCQLAVKDNNSQVPYTLMVIEYCQGSMLRRTFHVKAEPHRMTVIHAACTAV